MFRLFSTIVRWMAHLARNRTKKTKQQKTETASCKLLHESRPKAYGPGRRRGGGGSAPNSSKIWNFPGKTLMTQETAVEVKKKNNNNNNNNNNTTIVIPKRQATWTHVKPRCVVWTVNRWRELVDYAPINVKPAGEGEAGYGVGIWHFSKILPSNSCPRANHSSQLQPNFPTPGCTLLLNIPSLNPKKAQ